MGRTFTMQEALSTVTWERMGEGLQDTLRLIWQRLSGANSQTGELMRGTSTKVLALAIVTICTAMCTGNSARQESAVRRELKSESSVSPTQPRVDSNIPVSAIQGKEIWHGQNTGVDVWWTTVDLYFL